MRVLSICPSNTELMVFMGLSHLLVGLDDDSDWPSSIQHLPRVGRDLAIDMDKVEALSPDLVVASLSVPGMERNIEQLIQRGIHHIVLNPQSLKDIADDLVVLGKTIHNLKAGSSTAEDFLHDVNLLKQASMSVTSPPSIYFEWWPKPVFSPGGINWLTEVSELSGAYNIFSHLNQASIQTDWEEVRSHNPDVIALAWVGVQQEKMNAGLVKKRPKWNEMKAVRQEKILLLEEELYCRPSPRLIQGAYKLGCLLHPEIYTPLKDSLKTVKEGAN
ncbi:ABC transporter substrate-binding protein [Bacillus coahuilensis p1.1.43]|uniref:ABC transporter substrate-binding protein n=1 Tax=Bacillus coahuilensis p1.1.43 TaxID=1150625 RepID=A0A147K6A5_9BACI|nr:cobalamin-binding protein [Bacillus coahuilensis]KUP05360.1 ABC transporter substrate-binding protein [Bacillus coahuilensis p1.1.43]